MNYFKQVLKIFSQIGIADRAGEAITLNNIGLVYKNLEQYNKALNHYEQALALFLQVINPLKKAT
ncbi:MAG: tetratricopeptide repeat protein, partial [Dolichospermum sp.]